MRNKVLIIDGNNMLYRAYYKFKNLRTQSGVLSGVIYGFPYILHSIIKQQNPDKVVVVFDGGRDQVRMDLLPTYKKRESKGDFDKDNFYTQKAEVEKLLTLLGIPIVAVPKKEADDIIYLLCRKLRKKNSICIVSSDKDFKQLISPKVSVWDPKAGMRYTHKNIEKEIGYTPAQTVDYLIMDGDTSDNIPGMKGIGEKTIRKFMDEYGSIKSYLLSNHTDKKFPKSQLEEVFLRNRILIDLKLFYRRYLNKLEVSIKYPKVKKVNEKELAYFCAKYEIQTFLKSDFIKTFNRLITNK